MGAILHPPAIVQVVREDGWDTITGGESFSDGKYNYFEAWYDIPGRAGMPDQRYIVCRLIMPMDVARGIREQAGRIWARNGH